MYLHAAQLSPPTSTACMMPWGVCISIGCPRPACPGSNGGGQRPSCPKNGALPIGGGPPTPPPLPPSAGPGSGKSPCCRAAVAEKAAVGGGGLGSISMNSRDYFRNSQQVSL